MKNISVFVGIFLVGLFMLSLVAGAGYNLVVPSTDDSTTDSSSSSGGGGGGVTGGWLNTRLLTAVQLEQGASYEYGELHRARVVIGNETYHVGVVELTNVTMKINISDVNNTQQAILSVGDERRFDVTGDNYYDVLVTLNNIDAITQKANMSVKKIYEEITEETIAEEAEKEGVAKEEAGEIEETEKRSLTWLWIIIIGIIIIVAVVIVIKKRE